MTKEPQTISEARDQAQEAIAAAEEAQAFYLFFAAHPEFSCIANEGKHLDKYSTNTGKIFDGIRFSPNVTYCMNCA
jgi:hypothetical protein